MSKPPEDSASKTLKEVGTLKPVMVELGHADPAERSLAAKARLRKIRGLILLAGAVQQSEFTTAIGRSVLELPVSSDQSILDLWRGHALRLSRLVEQDAIPVRILINSTGISPKP